MYTELLQQKQRSPYSRLLQIENELDEHTLETTTTYTLLLQSRQGEVVHHKVECKTLSMME